MAISNGPASAPIRLERKLLEPSFSISHGEARGHSITGLLKALAGRAAIPEELQGAGLRLDRLYIPTRYANSFASGAPADYFDEKDAREAIGDAAAIVDFCEGQIPGSGQGRQKSAPGS